MDFWILFSASSRVIMHTLWRCTCFERRNLFKVGEPPQNREKKKPSPCYKRIMGHTYTSRHMRMSVMHSYYRLPRNDCSPGVFHVKRFNQLLSGTLMATIMMSHQSHVNFCGKVCIALNFGTREGKKFFVFYPPPSKCKSND